MATDATIRKFLDKAKAAAQFSDFPRQHLGAVMVKGNKVIAVGWNTTKTSPTQKNYNRLRGFKRATKNDGAIHAEIMTLLNTKYLEEDWSKVTIYIYRERFISQYNKNKRITLARPCPACTKAIKDRGIKTIVYTTDDGYAVEKVKDIDLNEIILDSIQNDRENGQGMNLDSLNNSNNYMGL